MKANSDINLQEKKFMNNDYELFEEPKIERKRLPSAKSPRRKKSNANSENVFIPEEYYSSSSRDSFVKGLVLIFIYFSVIIYSLLFMLTPEKTANLIFEGNLNIESNYSNNSLLNTNNNFYKLDTIRKRENSTIFEISKNFRYENISDAKNNLAIEIIYSQPGIINKIIIINENLSKEINNDITTIYHYYKVNDFPFWLSLYNKDNNNKINITSDILNRFTFDISG